MPEVRELKRNTRAGRPVEGPVHAQRLGGWEEIVGPAVLHEQCRARAREARPAVEPGELPAHGEGVSAGGLAPVGERLPRRDVGAECATRGGVEAGRVAAEVEPVVVALLHHAARRDALVRLRGAEVEEAAVRLQRIGEVRAGPACVGRGDLERRPVWARPGPEGAVGQPDAVAQPGEVEALDAAIRDARHAERVGPRHALVDQEAEQVLRVARLIAMVCEMDPAGVAARARARVRRAARAAESAC